MTTRWFGEKVERREDERLLRGAGRFLDDAGHDALAVAFVRSPHAHARIRGIDAGGERFDGASALAEIGAALFLSESTVKTHVAHALNKLRVPDRVAAVIYGCRDCHLR